MHVVGVMEVNERCVCALRCKVTKEHGGDGSHALTVSALIAIQREAMQDVEQGTLPDAIVISACALVHDSSSERLPKAIPRPE
jgi:hypothetical protein